MKRISLAVAVVVALFAVGSPASADPFDPEAQAITRQTYEIENCPPFIDATFELFAAAGSPPVATGSALETQVIQTDANGFAQVVFATTLEASGTYVVTASCGDYTASFGVVPLPSTPTLPATGATTDLLALLALAGVLGGSALILAGRRSVRPGASA